MREVAPGDLIFSFMDTRILAIGIAQFYSWGCPKPQEFGNAGQNWENVFPSTTSIPRSGRCFLSARNFEPMPVLSTRCLSTTGDD